MGPINGAAGSVSPVLLPSPTTADGHGGAGTSDKRQGGLNLRTAVTLLPTPKASDGTHGGPNQRDSSGRYYLPGQPVRVDAQWLGSNGKDYGPAVRRWEEITGHLAPCPTEPGTKGNRRLSPAFSEWMMGVEPGHVTDIVTDRNDALHVIGNGVVPRQAEAAFRFLMDDENWTDMDDIEAVELNGPTKTEKPRGKCTGCAFEYQLTTIRSGELKGTQVIRKHNSRTGPGLCSGAYDVPEGSVKEHTTGCTEEQRFGPSVCDGCCDDPDQVPQLADDVEWTHVQSAEFPDVVGVAPGGTPIVDEFSYEERQRTGRNAGLTVTPLDADGTPVGEPFDAVGAITLCPSPVDPFTGPSVVGGMEDDARLAAYGHPVSDQDATPGAVADVFTAPAPASDIPESTTTVSGQPEPDRDRWGRYLIMGTAHTRATTFAKLGANTKAIEAWNERNVIRGMTLRPDLLMLANGLEVKRDRAQLNSIAAQAKDAAGSKVAANIGTAYHAFSERVDAGLMATLDVPEQYRRRVYQYTDALARAGLTTRPEWIERTTAVRADQVGAPLPVAGTLDRIFQLPDGSLVIGDLKTGSDLSYGEMEIEVQLALYAHGVNTHGLFDWNIKQWQAARDFGMSGQFVRTDIAIVVHLPADGDGCTLYVADIERGWRDAQRLGPLQASLKEKSRFRTLTAADLEPVAAPEPTAEQYIAATAHHPAKEAPIVSAPLPETDPWGYAVDAFRTATDKDHLAKLYEVAVGLGFHVDQLAVLVGLGKDRLNALARG